MLQDWITITYQSLLGTWEGFITFIPSLIVAIIVFVIGWLIAIAIEQLISRVLVSLRFNRLFEHAHWKNALDKAELSLNPSEFVGTIFKWIFVIVFLLISVEILGFDQFALFLQGVIGWLPNLVVAIAIFVVAAIAADLIGKVTIASVERVRVGYSKLAGRIVRWSIWIFAFLAILFQLGVARPLIETFFTGIMAGLALAFGIAFGLGGKDMASDFLSDIRRHVRKN